MCWRLGVVFSPGQGASARFPEMGHLRLLGRLGHLVGFNARRATARQMPQVPRSISNHALQRHVQTSILALFCCIAHSTLRVARLRTETIKTGVRKRRLVAFMEKREFDEIVDLFRCTQTLPRLPEPAIHLIELIDQGHYAGKCGSRSRRSTHHYGLAVVDHQIAVVACS